jgi:hypothetical protein
MVAGGGLSIAVIWPRAGWRSTVGWSDQQETISAQAPQELLPHQLIQRLAGRSQRRGCHQQAGTQTHRVRLGSGFGQAAPGPSRSSRSGRLVAASCGARGGAHAGVQNRAAAASGPRPQEHGVPISPEPSQRRRLNRSRQRCNVDVSNRHSRSSSLPAFVNS